MSEQKDGNEAPKVAPSPLRRLDFQRGNSRVVTASLNSPKSGIIKRRLPHTPNKFRAAQHQSRKASGSISKLKLALDGPKLQPPVDGKPTGKTEEEEWQDVDAPPPSEAATSRAMAIAVSPKPAAVKAPSPPKSSGSGSPKSKKQTTQSRWQPSRAAPSLHDTTNDITNSTATNNNDTSTAANTSTGDGFTGNATPADTSESNTSITASFLGFSPSAAKQNLFKKLGRQSQKFKPASWSYRHRYSEIPSTPEGKMSGNFHFTAEYPNSHMPPLSAQTTSDPSKSKSFWLDPSTPGLLALYLQVGFNLAMVGALMYAIFVFYITIRNDVDLKVVEYYADIASEIEKCATDYVRNNCDPARRVPGMEIACQQWERCMQRNPEEVGRAKVSAETFGSIIEAFLRPIGIKSMLFLIGVFAGSMVVVNAIFSSRIGPRFMGEFAHAQTYQPAASAPPPPPPSAPAHAHPQSVPHFQPQVAYAAPPPHQSSFMYSPSPRLASPRHHQQQPSLFATLQSSPVHNQAYMNYPY